MGNDSHDVEQRDFPSSLELKTISLAIYNGDPGSAEACRDATLLAVLGRLREQRVAVEEALEIVVGLDRSDFRSGDGRLKAGRHEIKLSLGWRSAAMHWLVFRGLREGPLFFAIDQGTVAPRPLTVDEVRDIVHHRTAGA